MCLSNFLWMDVYMACSVYFTDSSAMNIHGPLQLEKNGRVIRHVPFSLQQTVLSHSPGVLIVHTFVHT